MLGTATKLQTARKINGTNFDGSGDITTTKWGTSRAISLSGAVSGSANVDGSGNVTISTTQANIAVISTNITTPAASSSSLEGNVNVNYPSGYNKGNCVVLSIMSGGTSNSSWNTPGATGRSNEIGSYGLKVSLTDSNISIKLVKTNDAEASRTVNIKLVLMKVS